MKVPTRHALKRSAALASVWSIVQVGWSSVASFLVFAVLVRHLSLAEIGIFALATSYTEIVKTVSGAGLSIAVQREHEVDDATLDTAFWGGIGISTVAAALMVLTAGLYAKIVENPQVAPLIYASAVLMVVSAVSRVHWALHLRAFGHKLLTIQTIIATIIGGIGAIIAVRMGAGVWALMIQAISSEVVGILLAWTSSTWRPGRQFSWRKLKALLGFGSGMVITRMLWSVLARVPDLVIGKMISVDAVGVYRIAWRLVDLLGAMLLAPLGKVVFQVLASLQKDQPAFERAYCRVLAIGSLVMTPAVVGFGATAQELIPLAFGDHVLASVPIAQVLAFSAPVFVANYFISSALTAVGRPFMMTRVALVQLVSTVLISLAAAPFGLLAVAIAYVARGYFTLPYQQYVLRSTAGIRYRQVFEAMRLPIIGSVGMVLVLLAIRQFSPIAELPALLRLVILVTTGALVYGALIVVIDAAKLKSHIEFGRSLIRKTGNAPAV